MKTIEISKDDTNDLLFMSFRYVLTRQTYMVDTYQNILIEHLKYRNVSTNNMLLMQKEISKEIDNINKIDLPKWNLILDLLSNNIHTDNVAEKS